MEPNNPNIPANPNIPTPKLAINPAPPSTPVEPPKESNKLILWFVLGLIVIGVLVGGTYLYLSRQQAVDFNQQAAKTQTPAPIPEENLENDLDSINVDDGASDFAGIDQDLQQL